MFLFFMLNEFYLFFLHGKEFKTTHMYLKLFLKKSQGQKVLFSIVFIYYNQKLFKKY